MRPALVSDAELLCVLLAQQIEVRAAWLAIASARCKEAGQMVDAAPLIELVSGLGKAAAWVEAALVSCSLHASPFAAVERELLGELRAGGGNACAGAHSGRGRAVSAI
ncbi:hypothetical protein QZH47_17675 [Pseudomonas corrugata]